MTPRAVPTPVAGGLHFKSISAGNSGTCGISTDGFAYCWGWNADSTAGSMLKIGRMLTRLMESVAASAGKTASRHI
jgi:hypothetical protein